MPFRRREFVRSSGISRTREPRMAAFLEGKIRLRGLSDITDHKSLESAAYCRSALARSGPLNCLVALRLMAGHAIEAIEPEAAVC